MNDIFCGEKRGFDFISIFLLVADSFDYAGVYEHPCPPGAFVCITFQSSTLAAKLLSVGANRYLWK